MAGDPREAGGERDPASELILEQADASEVRQGRQRTRRRLLAGGLVLALFAGVVAAVAARDPAPEEKDDDALPTPIALQLLGPTDGKNSIGLPVAVEPATGLSGGDTVTVTGHGFQPNEAIVVVQCAIEAGRASKGGEAAGVDGCDTTQVGSATATSDGMATTTFTVRTSITTSVTGLVDCSTKSDRCIVAMAASSDYDRSGAGGLTFGPAPETETPAGPTLVVDPAFDLADAQVVHVTSTGLPPTAPVTLSVCSADPEVCWATGLGGDPAALTTDAAGALAADVPVWRYLPGPQPATYVDCAVSACTLVLSTGTAAADPVPARLLFTPGGEGPLGPVLALEPGEDVVPGSVVAVRGAGFDPTTTVTLALCVTADTSDDAEGLCIDLQRTVVPEADGSLRVSVVVPSVDALGSLRPADPADPATPTGAVTPTPCDGTSTRCVVRATVTHGEGVKGPKARFGPDPVAITYAPPE